MHGYVLFDGINSRNCVNKTRMEVLLKGSSNQPQRLLHAVQHKRVREKITNHLEETVLPAGGSVWPGVYACVCVVNELANEFSSMWLFGVCEARLSSVWR